MKDSRDIKKSGKKKADNRVIIIVISPVITLFSVGGAHSDIIPDWEGSIIASQNQSSM